MPTPLWVKGQSGNPAGRPKGAKCFSTLFKEAVKKVAEESDLKGLQPEVAMVKKAINEALNGNFSFYRDIMDRNYGQPNQPMDMQGEILLKIAKEVSDNYEVDKRTSNNSEGQTPVQSN